MCFLKGAQKKYDIDDEKIAEVMFFMATMYIIKIITMLCLVAEIVLEDKPL